MAKTKSTPNVVVKHFQEVAENTRSSTIRKAEEIGAKHREMLREKGIL